MESQSSSGFSSSSGDDLNDNEEVLEDFVRRIPKVELHVHLDGCFDPKVLWSHLDANPGLLSCYPVSKQLPWSKPGEPPLGIRSMVDACNSANDFRSLCVCRRRYRKKISKDGMFKTMGSLEDMLTCFEFFLPLVRDNFELLEHLTYDFVKRQHEQNIIYTEVRYSPHEFSDDAKRALESVTKGLRKGCSEFGIVVNQILCAINFSPDWSAEVVELAEKYKKSYPCAVVGIDIAAGETHFELDSPLQKAHLDMCKKAQAKGINITLHAGETPESAEHVRSAIKDYGATRVGHGYQMTQMPEIVQFVREQNVHVEICPTSSLETGGWVKTDWKDHPGCKMHKEGISISLSSDDPAVFNTSLAWQYRMAVKKMGFTYDSVTEMVKNAVEASFQSRQEKDALLEKIRKFEAPYDVGKFNDRVHYE